MLCMLFGDHVTDKDGKLTGRILRCKKCLKAGENIGDA